MVASFALIHEISLLIFKLCDDKKYYVFLYRKNIMWNFLLYSLSSLFILLTSIKCINAEIVAYITSTETDNVVVISFEKKEPVFIKSIPVGKRPRGIAITPDQLRAYVTSTYDGTLSIIDLSTDTIIGKPIPVNSVPWAIAIGPGGANAYVTSFSDSTVSIIDLKTNQIIDKTLSVGANPFAIAACKKSPKVYVLNMGNSTISLIDTQYNEVKKTIRVGSHPRSIVITPDEKKAYIVCNKDNTVYVLDIEKDIIIGAPISVGKHPTSIGVSKDGKRVFVINKEDGTISVISTTTNQVEKTIPVKGHPSLIGAAEAENELHLLGDLQGELQLINLSTQTSIKQSIPLSFSPKEIVYKTKSLGIFRIFFARIHFFLSTMLEDKHVGGHAEQTTLTNSNRPKAHLKGLALNSGSQFLAVTDTKSDVVYLYNFKKGRYENLIYKVGKTPKEILFTPSGNKLLTVNPDGDSISCIDFSYNIPQTFTLNVAPRPRAFAITPDEKSLLVVNSRISQLQIIDLKDPFLTKKQLRFGSTLWAVAIHPKDMIAYVTDWADGKVYMVSIKEEATVIGEGIKVGKNPRAIALNTQGTRAYVTNWGNSSLSVIDLENGPPKVIKTLSVGKHPRAVAYDSDNQNIYVLNAQDGTLSIINSNTYELVKTLYIEKYPMGIVISKENNKAYISHRGKAFISVVDLKTNKLEPPINDCPPGLF